MNPRQLTFAKAILRGLNQAEAARVAGYSERTAKQAGCKLMTHPDILAYIGRAKESASSQGDAVVPEGLSTSEDPKAYLISVMKNVGLDDRLRADAAKALLPYMHPKLGEAGKKENKQEAAKAAGLGKFGASAPPRLAIVR